MITANSKALVCLILVLTIFVSRPVHAQVAGATLAGTVTDASGARVPGAKVSIKNTATGVERDIITDSASFYRRTEPAARNVRHNGRSARVFHLRQHRP